MTGKTSAGDFLRSFSEGCEGCGACAAACALLADLGNTPGEIAVSLIRDETDDGLLGAIQRCDLCGACAQDCPAGLQPAYLFLAARQRLMERGAFSPDDYDVMLVDRDWHAFTLYRTTYGIEYADLLADRCETLFFPGCTLATYAPELTRAAFAWLRDQGLRPGFTDLCCGKPLASIGLSERADGLTNRLFVQMKAAGAREIITTCPNCEAHLRAAQLPGIHIRSLYDLMEQAGVRLSGSQTLTFHDSCPDRDNETNPRSVRTLLSGFPRVEMASRGKDAICCGSGGIVSMIDPDLCTRRADRRLAEFSASRADICVTSCVACAYRLARGGQPGQTGQVRHCLELVFGQQVDYDQVEQRAHALWESAQGEINRERLAQAQLIPPAG
jgi:fumarate reductase (CoM/CoB) subunit B